jgi:hypothetical protein
MAAAEWEAVDDGGGDDARIDRFIDGSSWRLDPGDARLARFGYSVWIVIDALTAAHGDVGQVARDYRIPEDAVHAAHAFYRRHRAAIDARARANAAAFGALT